MTELGLPSLNRRRGITLMELIVAGGLLATLVSVLLPTLHGIAQVRSDLALYESASRELRNLAERGMAGDPPESLTLSPMSSTRFSNAELHIEVTPEPDTSLERIEMSLDWENSAGQRVAPIRLCWWRTQKGGEQ